MFGLAGRTAHLRIETRARNAVTGDEYVRMIAMSRIMLPNIVNVQASWLTVGKQVAQVCLHGGANDFGSIMIEENVVSSAGTTFRMGTADMRRLLNERGFQPCRRGMSGTMLFEKYW